MIFRTASLRLTALFSVLLLAVFAGFAIGVYAYVVSSFDLDAAGQGAIDAAEQSFADLRLGLSVGLLTLVILVPLLCYAMVRIVLRPVRSAYAAQSQFVDDASHEFRTPLAAIQGELELALNRPRDGDGYRTAITAALEDVEHLTTLTQDLLTLARGSAAQLSADFSVVDAAATLRRAAAFAAESADHAQGRLRIRTPDHRIPVLGSTDLLIRAFANVIDNALKFSPATEPVDIILTVHADHVRIETADRGPGMSSETRRHAFDRFWRASDARALRGHGLGLALVRQIIDAHRGAVRTVDRDGGGCRVFIDLPLTHRHAGARADGARS